MNNNDNNSTTMKPMNRVLQAGFLTLLRPVQVEDFWTYPGDPVIREMIERLKAGAPPRLSILEGPYGCGKTSLGIYCGMWSSCERWKDHPLPCGECASCRQLVRCNTSWVGRYWGVIVRPDTKPHEILEPIDYFWDYHDHEGMQDIWAELKIGPHTTNLRPGTIFIDEFQNLNKRVQRSLVRTAFEKRCGANIIIGTTRLGAIHKAIISRAAGNIYTLRYPNPDEVVHQLRRMAERFESEIDEEAARYIARLGNCEPRVCLGILEHMLIRTSGKITLKDVTDCHPKSDRRKFIV